MLASVCPRAADRVTVGFGQVPPLHYKSSGGTAIGFVVDSINEAARREKIGIRWKQLTGSLEIEPSLVEGRIDLFPAAIGTEQRRTRFWVSEPWWTEDLSIVARADLETDRPIDWRDRVIVLPSQAYITIASTIAPGAKFRMANPGQLSIGLSVSTLCAGEADGALLPHSTIDEILARRPSSCRGMDFQILETAHSLPLAVISRLESRRIAERLHSRIVEMARDGTLTAIASKYPRISGRSAVLLAETLRLRYERKMLWVALGGTLLTAVFAIFLFLREVRIQRALRRAIAEQAQMDRALRERTQELTVSNEELQAFAYSISHDLQEPLRNIKLYAQMLERPAMLGSTEGQSHLSGIRGNAERMRDMVQQLLLLSRVGRSDALRVPVQLNEVLSMVLQEFDPTIRTTSAKILIGPMPTVQGWPDRLSVVFQNLIGNALKYRKEDHPLRIEVCAIDRGTEWELVVSDNGIGFEQQYASKIFGVFRRLHANDKYGGTGVGLAIVKRVVERHGGRIWAEGKPGEGSTFHFTLPKQPVESAAHALGDEFADG